MITYEHWPHMPESWRAIDAELSNKLAASPVVPPDTFTPRERRCVTLAAEDNDRTGVSTALFLAEGTVKSHWEHAGNKLKMYLAEHNDPALRAESDDRMHLHRLAYVMLDNGLIQVGDKMEPAELTQQEAIYLKGLASGASSESAGKYARVSRWALTHNLLPPLKEKLGVSTLPGIMGSSYRMKLFVPRPSLQLPEDVLNE